jgi:hypothetical protein
VSEAVATVRVGAYDFDVHLVRDLSYGDDDLNGHIKHDECLILIDEDAAPQVQRVVLWHEMLHSILVQAGFAEQDERLIEAVSHGIVQVLRDNPDL